MPQQIDVPGMGIVEFPDGMNDDAIASAIKSNMAAPEKPFLEKLGNFARNIYNNPPPTIAAARDIIKGAPAAAQELTWGADPEAAREAAGTMAGAAGLGLSFKGPGGTNVGVAGRPISAEARTAPLIAPRVVPPPTTAEEAIAAAARGGYTLPSYVATEGTVVPQVASSVRNVPWAGQPITRTHDELIANMGRAAGEIAPAAGTAETAGERARTGLTAFIKTRSQEPVSEAYKAVDALIDPNVRVPLDNTREAIGQIMAERTRSRIPGQSKAVQTVFDAVQDPRGMDYAGTKGLRSFLGEKTPMELASQGLAPSEVKRIYGAMSRDLGNVVREAGGPEAFSAWKEANALTRLTKLQQQALSKVVGAEGAAAPEAVFNRLVTFANSKAGADLNRLRLAKQAMGPDAWNEVGSALIDRLGKAPNEQFSPQRFMTAFGNMASAARNELFSGRQLAALTDLFTVSKHIADRITRFGNPSGTARGGVVGQAITGGALFAEPISTLTTLVGARLAAEALSRPAVVRAATAVSRASLSRNPVATRRAIALLQATAVREGLISAAAPQQQQKPVRAEAGRPFEDAVRADLRQQFPNETPEQIDQRVAAVTGAMTSNAQRQEFYPEIHGGLRINQPNWERFLAAQPRSTNIEDRRTRP